MQDTNFKPVYLSVNRIRDIFNLISTRSFNQLSSADFRMRGFLESDAFLAISALRFLGIINEDGSKTQSLAKLQLRGEERTKALGEIVKSAYSKLFTIVSEANKLSRDELHNEFMAVYGISPRVANSAVPAFLWLCAEAGLEINEQLEVRERKATVKIGNKGMSKKRRSDVQVPPISLESEKTLGSLNIGKFKLMYPKEEKVEKALAHGKFKVVYDGLELLSKELFDGQEQNNNGGVTEGLKVSVSKTESG